MNFRKRRAASFTWLTVLVLLAVVVYAWKPMLSTGEAAAAAAAAPQDLMRIESRLSQIEQRFYSIEASIRNLEQQTRLSDSVAGRTGRERELDLLRAEVATLGRRMAEVECGLVRVDERTLSAPAREARRKSAAIAGDPCRLNANAPLLLQARP